jgi:Asp-tRNA(Asn)/Glu-tRNA(Gln) amidotransferase A subunit family amidase
MGTNFRRILSWSVHGILAAVVLIFPRPVVSETNQITASDIASAAKIDGLAFTEEEQAQMLKGLQNRLKVLDDLRHRSFPNALPPALLFNPLPPGFQVPTRRERFRWRPPQDVQLPSRRDDLAFYSLAELAGLLRSKRLTSEDLTRFCLDRLKRYGPPLHCLVTLTEERAMASARKADVEIASGKWRGPLHGVPYGAKDLLAARGTPTTWGAPPYTNQVFDTDAAVVRKLDEAGAVLVAKLSLGELAMGDVWFGGLTRNPWQPDKGSSGSSAGSAAAVAAGLVPFAIGSETLGSIVSPSTVCGVTGLRPTFGRVSRTGAMTLCWSLDKLGPLARSAQDCALVLETIRGPDGQDLAAIDAPFNYPSKRRLKDIRIGWLKDVFSSSKANQTNNLASIEVLRRLGADLKPVTLPKYPNGAFYMILEAEAAAAFDELTRSHADRTLVQQADWNWPNAFRMARTISAVDYIQANRVRTQLMSDMTALFRDIDVLVSPSFGGDTLLFSNFTGHPSVVVPNGDKTGGAEASLCFLGKLFGEADALAVAEAYQQATTWHRQKPDLSKLTAVQP